MQADKPLATNIPEFSVSELAFSLKKTLEENYGRVRVRGELSRVSIAASGHMYSSLKDESAVIDAVCWKGVMAGLSVKPEEGLEVICTGRISTYPSRSNYQLIIESMELAGQGALLKMLEERRKKLAAEGLFDVSRKKPLPFLPEVIGVVTSPTGAVIRDILHRLNDRFPRHVLVWPVLVQGAGAAQQVAAAIEGFERLPENGIFRPDLIIVARGGGSLEDLMPFNEEIVVRAAAACSIPLISAIGHETDTTLIDYAADARAPTPTGAAEMAVPVRANLRAQVMDDGQRLLRGIQRLGEECAHRLKAAVSGLGDPSRILENWAQRLDFAGATLTHIAAAFVAQKREALMLLGSKIRTPEQTLALGRQGLLRWGEALVKSGQAITLDPARQLGHASQMLEAYSYENVLSRGFVVVRDADNIPVTNPDNLKAGQAVQLEFKARQKIEAEIKGAQAQEKPRQDRLF